MGRQEPAPPRRPGRSWRRRIAFSGALLAALALLGLLGLELVLRSQRGHILGVPSQLQGMFTDCGGTLLTTPGWRGEHTVDGQTHSIRMNDLGMRGPDVPRQKPPDERRLLLLGDSMVWGYGVAEAETFAALLESAIEGTRVGNAGGPGYGTRKSAAALERIAGDFEPDAVVFCLNVGNDFQDDTIVFETIVGGFGLRGPVAHAAHSSLRLRMALRFHVCYLAETWIERNLPSLAMDRTAGGEPPEQAALRAALPPEPMQAHGLFMDRREPDTGISAALATCRESLLRIRRAAGDAPLLVLVLPVWAQITAEEFESELAQRKLDPAEFDRGLVGRRIGDLCASLDIACMDLTPLLIGDDEPLANWQAVGHHFTPRGHRRVARWIEPPVRDMLGRRRG